MMVTGGVKLLLRLEGLALLLAALVVFWHLNGNWWLFLVLLLAPDASFAGYLLSQKFGTIAYNTLHSTIGAFVLAAIGWWFANDLIMQIAAIWFAHIGLDRAVGYGLKYASGFKDTHLGVIGKT